MPGKTTRRHNGAGKAKGRRGDQSKGQRLPAEPVEVWLQEPGQGMPGWAPRALEYLPSAPPLAQVGDILLLPRNVTGDTAKQAFAWGGKLTPFKVISREHVYFREDDEKLDPLSVNPARYMRSLLLVRRLSEDQYNAEPDVAAG